MPVTPEVYDPILDAGAVLLMDVAALVIETAFSNREKDLAKRTLTQLYNQRPAWLASAHQQLDAAVAAAYGWHDYTPDMADDEILRRLLALNLARSQNA